MARYTSLPPAPQSAHASAQVMHSHSSTKKVLKPLTAKKKEKKKRLTLLCCKEREEAVSGGELPASGCHSHSRVDQQQQKERAPLQTWHISWKELQQQQKKKESFPGTARRPLRSCAAPSVSCHGRVLLRTALGEGEHAQRASCEPSRDLLLNQRRRKKEEEGELSAHGAEERSVLVVEEAEWDQLPPPLPVSCRELRSFSSRERAPLELRPQRRS